MSYWDRILEHKPLSSWCYFHYRHISYIYIYIYVLLVLLASWQPTLIRNNTGEISGDLVVGKRRSRKVKVKLSDCNCKIHHIYSLYCSNYTNCMFVFQRRKCCTFTWKDGILYSERAQLAVILIHVPGVIPYHAIYLTYHRALLRIY